MVSFLQMRIWLLEGVSCPLCVPFAVMRLNPLITYFWNALLHYTYRAGLQAL